jgi:type I restriction enzyme M protein
MWVILPGIVAKKEAKARVKINKLLEESKWRFFDSAEGKANVLLENNVKITKNAINEWGEDFEKTGNGFVDYIAEHLTPTGRGAVIVPEGIIFQFMDRRIVTKASGILFIKIENDGFDLGAQRRAIDRNDLPEAERVIKEFQQALMNRKAEKTKKGDTAANVLIVPKEKIAENGDYNLTGERYRVAERRGKRKWPMVRLGDDSLFSVESGGTPDSKNSDYWNGDIPWVTLIDLPQNDYITRITDTQRKITKAGLRNSSAKLMPASSIIVSTRATIGRVGINTIPLCTNQGFKNVVIKDNKKIIPIFLAFMIKQIVPKMDILASGGTFKEISKTNFCSLKVPLPPLEIQQEIVANIEAERKIVDGCRELIVKYEEKIKKVVDGVWGE